MAFVRSGESEHVAGSGIHFTDLGVQALKGIPDGWHLFMVDS
jgi:hypothetical protein